MIGTRLVDRYEVVGELGRGGMGIVYRARDPLLNRDVAVKLIPPMLLTADAEERFRREAQIVAQMNHPSIVTIFDMGRHEGSLFFLMPVVGGRNLRRYLSERGRSIGDVVEIGIRIAEALDYSHARGVIHRDIKPENVMISDEEGATRVYVMDFGLAKSSSENRLTKTGTLVGTVAYFSPEQVIARDVDLRSDIYSLGVVLYECLAGEPPFTGEVQSLLYRIVHEYPRSIRSVGMNIPQELDEIILCCLAKDPARRYQRASEVAGALRRCQSRLGESQSVVLSAVVTTAMQRPAVAQLIDREKEFAALQQRLNAAIAGECQFVALGGDAGVGKSRLAEEVESLARARKIRVVRGRFIEQNFAYHGLLELIHDSFRSRDASSSGAALADFSDLAPELVAAFPSLADIPALHASQSGAQPVRRDDRTYIFELLARGIGRISSGQPLVLILENLHSAEGSIEALQYIIPRLAALPLLFIGTYRQTEIHRGHPLAKMLDSFSDDPRFASIVLGPLTPSHHREMVLSVIGGGSLSPSLFERIYKATEGNPFFTRELVRSLMESGDIVRDDAGVWTLSREMAISSGALPATIQQAVEKRIERLPQDVREVLAVASVLGRSFEYDDLEALAEETKSLEKLVDRLIADGLLEEDRESRGDRLAFTSAVVRDVLYGSLSRRRRRSLHRRYAEHLEKSTRRLESVYPQLVHHYSEGDEPEKTVEFGLLHARRSLQSFSADDALAVLRIVIEFASDAEWSGSKTAEAEARLLLARAHRLQAAHAPSMKEAEAAHRLFLRHGDTPAALDALLFAAHATWDARKIDEAKRWVEEGIELARTAGRADALGDLLSLGATIANLRGDYERARLYLEEGERLEGRKEAPHAEVPLGGVLRCAIANLIVPEEPSVVNTDEDAEVLALVFENVVVTDESGRVRGALARSWDVADDGRTLRLELDPAACFSDGTPVLAADVRASFERAARARSDKIPAALEPVAGIAEFRAGTSPSLRGIRVASDRELLIELERPLAFYPATLADPCVAIARATDGRFLGSGPFAIVSSSRDRIVLRRNERYWKGRGSCVDGIEFEVTADAPSVVSAFRNGTVDVVRDLPPREMESLVRDSGARVSYVEAARRNTYFLLFNQSGPNVAGAALRNALTGALNVPDLVWRTIGRLGQPASSLIPPSIFGHDAGRRTETPARETIADAIGRERRRLVAIAHPTFQDRYAPLAGEIATVWRSLGVDLEIRPASMDQYLAAFSANSDIDVLFGRWNPDYDDADTFSYGLFHSANGIFHAYFASPECDRILEEARVETRALERDALYRSFEDLLRANGVLLPLFYEVNYRVASRRVQGIQLRTTRPYVNYSDLGVSEAKEPEMPQVALRTSEIHIPIIEETRSIDPADVISFNDNEVAGTVFESLTRCGEGARIGGHLAESFTSEDGGRRWRFVLRDGVRFHDGRRLTARDVRHSWERRIRLTHLQRSLRCIRGAAEIARGETRELQGFHIVSPREFALELTQPMAFFPALLTTEETAIIPEGTDSLGDHWRRGCAGTGPFRVVDFQPGRHLELERNPDYWRAGLPRSDRLIFHLGLPPSQIRSDFLAGKLSLASDLVPADVEEMLHDPELASRYHSVPRLSIYFIVPNVHHPVLSDVAARRAMFDGLDVDAMVRRTLGRVVTPATGLIPPGLLGYTGVRPSMPPGNRAAIAGLRLRAAVQPMLLTQFGALTKPLMKALSDRGVTLDIINTTAQEYLDAVRTEAPDLVIGRWVGSIPDADYFTGELLYTQGTFLGHLCGTPEVNALAERARSEPDVNARNALYRQIDETIAREALMLPLFYEEANRFAGVGVDGLVMSFTHPEVAYEMLTVRR